MSCHDGTVSQNIYEEFINQQLMCCGWRRRGVRGLRFEAIFSAVIRFSQNFVSDAVFRF